MERLKYLCLTVFLLAACTNESTQIDQESSSSQANNEPSEVDAKQDEAEEEVSEQAVDNVDNEEKNEDLIEQLPDEADISDWNLVLVNEENPIAEDFISENEIVQIQNEEFLNQKILEAWEEWNQAAVDNGHNLFVISGYRTVDHQSNNYNNSINSYIEQGYSQEEAEELTKEYLTKPGYSEHHTGLAIDLLDHEWVNAGKSLDETFESQESQKWLTESMADYGFILRYPKGKEDITNIEYEPWHFRYVGIENAQFIEKHDIVLEEYIQLLEKRDNL